MLKIFPSKLTLRRLNLSLSSIRWMPGIVFIFDFKIIKCLVIGILELRLNWDKLIWLDKIQAAF